METTRTLIMSTLKRTTFETSRLLEFFTEKELQMQIGHPRTWWPIALTKELIDNALDACETAGITPEIEVTLEDNAVSVCDNGPGLPVETLERSLDYLVRVSDKNHYVSPTRGQLGNALKCVWAAPFVIDGEAGRVEVATNGQLYQIDVTLDRIAQRPNLELATQPGNFVKTGTFVKMHWPEIAGYLSLLGSAHLYNSPLCASGLVLNYAAFNPHATFHYHGQGNQDPDKNIESTDTDWRKWEPADPTSAHWYSVDRLRDLIAAYIARGRETDETKTVREFVSEFDGLSSSTKQKQVLDAADMAYTYLQDLVENDTVTREPVARLLAAMQDAARQVSARRLGKIGEEHLTKWLIEAHYTAPDSIKYKKIDGTVTGMPFVLEAAFGVHTEDLQECGREIVTGLNWAPALGIPFIELSSLLGEARADSFDPVTFVVHLAFPQLEFTDRGKSKLSLPDEIGEALQDAVRLTTKDWTKAKRKADREERVRQRELEEMRKAKRQQELTIIDAAYRVMEEAYMKASANNTLPANARQIMYAARPGVEQLAGKYWKNSSYFMQTILPQFQEDHPELTANWDVVYDARGELIEPHTRIRAPLGTLEVRRYVRRWKNGEAISTTHGIMLDHQVSTAGPANRYQYTLFVEKEGFDEILKAANIAKRFDLAIMSTKGMPVTACRRLVEDLSQQAVTILVIRDFDKSGFSIANTLRTDTDRYQFEDRPNVIDLGLRLSDVEEMELQSERVTYGTKKDPRINLRENGATEEERKFLVQGGRPRDWQGERVELNAMTSDQFIAWLEHKLEEAGAGKTIPENDVLKDAYRRAIRIAAIQAAIDEAAEDYDGDDVEIPGDLSKQVKDKLDDTNKPWDDVLWNLVRDRDNHD